MTVFELFSKYVRDPLTSELGAEAIGGAESELSPEAAEALEAVLKVVAPAAPLVRMYCSESDGEAPAELLALGFTAEPGESLDLPENGVSAKIALNEYERWELFYGPGYLHWSYFHKGMGYPVADCVWY